jgi:hypothetical protein
VSGPRLLRARAGFWTLGVAGMAALVYALLTGLADAPMPGTALVVHGVAALVGAALAAVLAVGMGVEAADVGDDGGGARRGALGLTTGYLFMLVAGLYNVALLAAEQQTMVAARALTLYALAAALAFASGADRVMRAYDHAGGGRRAVSPVTGALLAILLFLGGRAVSAAAEVAGAGARAQTWFTVWAALVGAGAAVSWLRHRPAPTCGGPLRAALLTGTVCLLAAALVPVTGRPPGHGGGHAARALLLIPPLAAEVVVRGLIQGGLQQLGNPARVGPARLAAAALVSGCAAWAVTPPGDGAGVVVAAGALLPAAAFALTGRLWSAVAVRLALVALG